VSGATAQQIASALGDELAVVVGALVDTQASVAPGTATTGAHWVIEVVVDDGSSVAEVGVGAEAAAAMTSLVMGLDAPVPAEAVIDTVREVFSQVLGALSMKPVAGGAHWKVGEVAYVADYAAPSPSWPFVVTALKLSQPLTFVTHGTFQSPAVAGPRPVAVTPRATPPKTVPPPAASGDAAADRIDVILDIDLPLIVRFGRTELPMRTLTRIGPGSLIDLGRSPDDPVEILVSNRVVARGEVVIVSGNYGIRILDVVSPRDRMRSLGE
jgi:flagellar motor switch protein FliN/FliY